ncbi:AraC-type DNA-binding protein [Collimonas sp. OK307]|uniref:AraC family transcriptional regulator n=1 Tax=Collimonas sp. OK307 TaxID=1801620 RepID=UPI0008F2A8C6|nr:AraC family transcriptional regulator [Collimonas sp. OK307]SFI32670.1 AraC-type DNA-binding protein [Collimonas sp. OK307]
MELTSPSIVHRWSTDSVEPSQRFAFWSETVSAALTPLTICGENPGLFQAETKLVSMGPIQLVNQVGSCHRALRGAREVSRTEEHTYNLLINMTSSWHYDHRGVTKLGPGDALFTNSLDGFNLDFFAPHKVVNLRLPAIWIRRWLSAPDALVGLRIPCDSNWSRALTSFVVQLTTEFVSNSPVPHSVLVDQIGTLLALVAAEMGGYKSAPSHGETALGPRILDCISQRCAEPTLTADDVAAALHISVRTLHRSLVAGKQTFGAALISARATVALRMLESPLFRRLTTAEISRRAGFSSPAHFSRVLKRQTGRTPTELRKK